MTSQSAATAPDVAAFPQRFMGQEDVHKRRRRFIGPMPATALNQTDHKRPQSKKRRHMLTGRGEDTTSSDDSDSDDSSSLSDVIRRHALEFFLRHGGHRDNWGESQQKSVRKEMRRRWRQSEWGRARKQQKRAGASHKWIGNSFDVGVFLGVDILDEAIHPSPQITPVQPSASTSAVLPTVNIIPPSVGADTFVTARTDLDGSALQTQSPAYLTPVLSHEQETPKFQSLDSSIAQAASASDEPGEPATHVTPSPGSSNSVVSPCEPESDRTPGESSLRLLTNLSKGKRKDARVHYEDTPAPPSEVLARTGSAVKVTSAGAVERTTNAARAKWGDIIMRDRMLIRVSYTEDAVLSTFDESRNRTTRHLENDGWREYIVAWRKDRLELYKDHRIFGKGCLTQCKRLVHVIPLGSSSTRLSLYSFVDLSFCITCPPAPLKTDSKRMRYFRSSRGTNIFVFKLKCRSRAVDWHWHLWRYLGGQLPPNIEVRSPLLDIRMTIDVPGADTADVDAAYDVFQRDNIIRLCKKYLHNAPEYQALLERRIEEGTKFELAWRHDTDLDWVWQETDVLGKPREWAVLCGLALKQADRPSHLEFRAKAHFPIRLHMKDGTRLDEPPAVEGYLDRIRPGSQLNQSVYLVSHDGYLFSLTPLHAHPPHPPGVPVGASRDAFNELGTPGAADTLRKAEVRRGRLQILEATGMFDLRSIVAVRRAFQYLPHPRNEVSAPHGANWEDSEAFWTQVDRSESDDEDAGGETGMAHARDKTHMHMRRSFELVLISGKVLRYEAYSCQTALEWIVRLRQLVSYWKKRHEVDAHTEMNIAHVSTGRERITPHRPREDYSHAEGHKTPPEPLPEREATLPDLSLLYNWCVLDGCHAMLKCGRLYGRKGWWGQYKHIQLVLLSGHLVQYHISGTSTMHHRKKDVVNLLDAYVVSGYFAAHYLPDGQYDANAPPIARRYQDGLETDDSDEDTLFVVWYRKVRGAAPGVRRNNAGADIPPLKAKRKVMVFRTRSKLERDAWVWAINVEIEKVVRASKEREEAVRQAGELLKA